MDLLSLNDQASLLRNFLAGKVSTTELAQRLAGHLSIEGDIYSLSVQFLHPLDVNIAVTPADLQPMLERYLRWEIDDEELARWATYISLFDVYNNPLGLTDQESDWLLDPMWDLLAELSAPALLGRPLRDRVVDATSEVTKMQAAFAARAV